MDLLNFRKIFNKIREKIFDKVFKTAEIANMTQEELFEYEDSLKQYRDLKNSLDFAEEKGFSKGKEEGINEGIEKGKIATAKELKKLGVNFETIKIATGLSIEEIEKL
eukprot:TRINITY_DN2752_c0_g2_i4.p2 TRINITY_DN2752_c0_g2~~TRINITY_DN2752_c0_g2_i4.p2  ORF type:complete len:108 (-),score=4.37 TRINITY_DN2752_c0_g2_i4:236-559(-)